MKRFGIFILSVFLVTAGFVSVFAESVEHREARLREELQKYEEELKGLNAELGKLKQQSATYERDVNILTTQINQAKTNIKAKTLAVQALGKEIEEKNKTVVYLDSRIEKGQESLAQLIRKTNELDSFDLIEVVLAEKDMSKFFQDIDYYSRIQSELEILFEEIRGNKVKTIAEKEELRKKQNAELDAKKTIEAAERQIAKKQGEAKTLLGVSKNQEAGYKNIIADKEKKAAQIRAALFELRGSEGIPFGKAYEYAKNASAKTGIRPAFLLAILTQESDLGKNIGSCLINNSETGDGAGKNTGSPFEQVMKAPRDTVPFLAITERLGRDWKMTPVSCPPGAKYFVGRGFGGGMGPSQFIPSTWELFKNSIGTALGLNADKVDPWNPEHAFMATAVYMRDLGAGIAVYSAERDAACKYYSGRRCDAAKPANSFYGNQVMAKAQNIQETMIDVLEDN